MREAERGETSARAAYMAMQADVKRDVSHGFLKWLGQASKLNQPDLPGFESAGLAFPAGATATPHERCIAQHAQRLHLKGIGGTDLMQQALSNGLAEMRTQQLRQVEQHVYLNGGSDAREVMAAVRIACNGIAEKLAKECCGISPRSVARPMRTRIDLDEDLAIHR